MSWPFIVSGDKAFHETKTMHPLASARKPQRRRIGDGLHLELLEDRTLLSNWVPMGPAPILNGASGGDPATGRIAGLASDPSDPNTVYIAAAGGGVWKTSDGGQHWAALTDDQQTLFMGAIAVAPSDPETLYAGTGEADNSGDSFYGRGVLKSTDAGKTWTLLGRNQFNRETISRIIVSPTDPSTVYVAVSSGGVDGALRSSGIWKSTDGGATWIDTTARISTYENYSDLIMDPTDPQVLFAAVGTTYGAAANGVYKTTNGGSSWTAAGNFSKGTIDGNIKIAMAPSNDSVLYASIVDPSTGVISRMLKSVDGGSSWQPATIPRNYMGTQGWYDSTLTVDPSNPNIVYAGGITIVRSLDGGATWLDISVGLNNHGPHPDHHAFGFDAAGRLLDGTDGGIWRLDNQTPVRWTDLNGNLAITQFYGIALHPTNPNIAYGTSQDNGTDKFTGSLPWSLSAGGDGGFVRVDFQNPHIVYHTYQYTIGNQFLERSENDGSSWVQATNGINTKDPANFYVPYVMDPSDSSRLLLGTNRVYETTNRAVTWKPISSPNANGWLSSDPIDCLAAAPSDVNTIYASAGGLVFVTTNHGLSWHVHTIPGVADSIADLLVDPTNSLIAYAVRDLFDGGHVFRTTNGGVTWTNISGNLPNLPTYTIVLAAGTLYVGNDDGVYMSANMGASWSRLGNGLPHAQVRELVINPTLGILAAGTHGRGLWELNLGSPATHFALMPVNTPVMAGSPFQFTVTALDDQNNPVTGYSGTIHFTSSDRRAVLPGDYTFAAADAGVHLFTATLTAAGSQTITATDTTTGMSGTGNVAVMAGAPDHLLLTAPGTVFSGVAFDVTVTVQDAFNNTVASYLGTVHFTSTDSDPAVMLPADYSFTASDAGTHTFAAGVTLITSGSQTLTVDDLSLGILSVAIINVTVPAAPRGPRGSSGGLPLRWSTLVSALTIAPRPILAPTSSTNVANLLYVYPEGTAENGPSSQRRDRATAPVFSSGPKGRLTWQSAGIPWPLWDLNDG